MKRITGGIAVALLLGALAVAALGVVDAADAAKRRTQTKTLRADPNGGLTFNKDALSAKAGRVKLVMRNPRGSGLKHGIAIEGHGVDKDGRKVKPGKTSTVTAKLAPGTYEFYCPVAGHKDAGMEGKLTVR
jgi:plastocyanin